MREEWSNCWWTACVTARPSESTQPKAVALTESSGAFPHALPIRSLVTGGFAPSYIVVAGGEADGSATFSLDGECDGGCAIHCARVCF